MPHQHHIWPSLCAAAVLALTGFNLAQSAPLMIVGNDEKLAFDDNGKPLLSPPGKELGGDSIWPIRKIRKTVANLPLKNSIVGPPVTSQSIRPARLLWSGSVDIIKDGDALQLARQQDLRSISRPIRPSWRTLSRSASSRRD